mmetsp:Transcript_6152/g.15250  ORF Transcript_6152/g.15250 Transcript_6152/m.15250 type:complete len:211 (+) Transcript_6152:656-1288(+)
MEKKPGGVKRSSSVRHCTIAMTGTITRLPPWYLPAASRVLGSARSRLRCAIMRAMVCRVLPMPISSARIPPRTLPSSCAHSQPRPSFWYGSMCASSCSGGSRSLVHRLLAFSTSCSTSTSVLIGSSLLRTISRTSSCSSLARSARPAISFTPRSISSRSAGNLAHARCDHRMISPQPFSSCSTPTRSALAAISSPHTTHLARPVFACSAR